MLEQACVEELVQQACGAITAVQAKLTCVEQLVKQTASNEQLQPLNGLVEGLGRGSPRSRMASRMARSASTCWRKSHSSRAAGGSLDHSLQEDESEEFGRRRYHCDQVSTIDQGMREKASANQRKVLKAAVVGVEAKIADWSSSACRRRR
jgi:hypothetical protein